MQIKLCPVHKFYQLLIVPTHHLDPQLCNYMLVNRYQYPRLIGFLPTGWQKNHTAAHFAALDPGA